MRVENRGRSPLRAGPVCREGYLRGMSAENTNGGERQPFEDPDIDELDVDADGGTSALGGSLPRFTLQPGHHIDLGCRDLAGGAGLVAVNNATILAEAGHHRAAFP